MSEKKVPDHIMKIFKQESARLQQLDEMSSEYSNILNYLEWTASLPYGVITIFKLILKINLLIPHPKKLKKKKIFFFRFRARTTLTWIRRKPSSMSTTTA